MVASSSETSSFVVSANYDVQSEKQNNRQTPQEQMGDTTTKAWHELLPTVSSWHLPKNPEIYVNNAPKQTPRGLGQVAFSPVKDRPYEKEDIIYGSSNSFDRAFKGLNQRIDTLPGYTPSVNELQELISRLIQRTTKVHQVVKVPAIYELHLQSHESPKSSSWNWNKAVNPVKKLTSWNPRGSRHVTKTWNLPKKINYFPEENYGKYAYPRPFSHAPRFRNPNAKTLYGSVSVPITPGSTAVSFLDDQAPGNFQRLAGVPDLSLYYAKKKEIEQQNRRNDKARLKEESWKKMRPFFAGLNYIVHVREKTSPGRF